MPTMTINTIEDLHRILRENPEWREEIRRTLLTDELLQLPAMHAALLAEFREFVVATNRRFDEVDGKFARVDKRFDEVDGKFARVDSQFTVVNRRLDRLEHHVDALRGDALETKMPTKLCQMLSDTLDIRRTQVIWMARNSISPASRSDEFALHIERASDEGIITDDEEDRLSRTDMVVRSLRKADGERLWIAAEASGVIDRHDIDRARQSAIALKKVYGNDAIPVVYGYRIGDEQRMQAKALNGAQEVQVFLEDSGV